MAFVKRRGGSGKQPANDGGGVDQKLIRELAALLKETDLTEIEVERQGFRLRVSRQGGGGAVIHHAMAPAVGVAHAPAGPVAEAKAVDLTTHPGAVHSPMVGTVYVAPSPGAAPFVKIGDAVSEGQTVLIVEAMKTMNPIPAPRAGRITQILVSDGQPVEYGETLMVIE
jgi:acetyl-CoA carboxylase biotin carboxyl carrier protein